VFEPAGELEWLTVVRANLQPEGHKEGIEGRELQTYNMRGFLEGGRFEVLFRI
jgi:hypothetical protein